MSCIHCPHCRLKASLQTPTFKGGKPPYGFVAVDGKFRFDYSGNGKQLVDLMLYHSKGYSYRDIAQGMNAQEKAGPTGGKWHHGSVRRVVENGKRLSHLIPLEYVLSE